MPTIMNIGTKIGASTPNFDSMPLIAKSRARRPYEQHDQQRDRQRRVEEQRAAA